jgi:hypothetical protein
MNILHFEIIYNISLYYNMNLIDNDYYIIRRGDFATDGNTKILYCILSIFLCIEEYITNKSTDCFSIMIGSTIIWTSIEFILHLSNTRVIKQMSINWFGKKLYLPNYLGIFLQGFQEGGFITTSGLYFGDRLFHFKYFIILHILILFIILNIILKNNNTISSKRKINTPGSLACIGGVSLYNIYYLYQNPYHFARQFTMFTSIVYISSIWTFVTWYKGFRSVEIYTKHDDKRSIENDISIDNNTSIEACIKPISKIDTLLVLGYDVIFEIGVAYMFFYNLFIG